MFRRDAWLAETLINTEYDYGAVVDRGIPYEGDVQIVE